MYKYVCMCTYNICVYVCVRILHVSLVSVHMVVYVCVCVCVSGCTCAYVCLCICVRVNGEGDGGGWGWTVRVEGAKIREQYSYVYRQDNSLTTESWGAPGNYFQVHIWKELHTSRGTYQTKHIQPHVHVCIQDSFWNKSRKTTLYIQCVGLAP